MNIGKVSYICVVNMTNKQNSNKMYYDIVATPNKHKRKFTIRKYIDGELLAKYRTAKMSKEEFNDHLYFMEADWQNFLNNSHAYYLMRKRQSIK